MKGISVRAEMPEVTQRPSTDLPIENPSKKAPESELSVSKSGLVLSYLAKLPERTLVDERALASALGVSMRTVRRMVGRYELPPPVPFAGRSMWQVGRVLAWFEARADRVARNAQSVARRISQTDDRWSTSKKP
jgi:predicted DNA-binding transcriptional regulator AlpA